MNKNILAVAIAAAVAAPAVFANATVYGNAHMSAESLSNGKDSVGAISSNSSYIGVKGSEDLAGGLKAVYQFEMQVAMDNDGTSTAANATGGNGWQSQRNTFVGLGGGFGTVLLGKHDTPLKMASRKFDLFSDRLGDTRNLTAGNGDAGFGWDLRPNNVVAYVSPAISGFTGILAYVADENGTGISTANNSSTGVALDKADAYSAIVMGAVGKLDVALAYENHNTAYSGIGKSMAATRLGASYDFGMVKVNGLYANQDTVAGGLLKDRNIYGLGAAIPAGAAGTVKAQYTMADATTSGAKNGANMISVGYDHALSKNTTAYAVYAVTNNDKAGTFGVAGGGHGESVGLSAAGKDPSGFAVGIQHKF